MTCWTVTIIAYNFDATVQEMCSFFTLLTQVRLAIGDTVKKYTGAMLNTSVYTELHCNMMKCDSFFHLFKFLLLNNSVNELDQFGSNCDILVNEVAEIYNKSVNVAVDKVIVQSLTSTK